MQFNISCRKGDYSVKKLLVFCLTATVAAACCTPVFADGTGTAPAPETVTVSLSTIESTMTEYNLDIKKAANDFSTARDNYEDSAKEKPDKDTYQVAGNTYETAMQQQVDSAIQSYLTYCSDVKQLAADQADSDRQQKQFGVYQEQLNRGYVTRADYDSCLEKAQTAKNTLAAQDSKVTQEKKSLRTLLNIPETDNMTIVPAADSDMNLGSILKLNYTADLNSMLSHDLTIDSANLNYFAIFFFYDSWYTEIYTAKIQAEQAQSSETAAFKSLYDTLTNSYQSYQQELQQVERKQADVTAEQQKLQRGYTSQSKYDDLVCDLKDLQSKQESDRNTLYFNFLKYNRMKNGYEATGSTNA